MGTAEFAVPSLQSLLDAGYDILSVVTGPDKPRGRGQKLSPTPVAHLARTNALPVLQPVSVKDPAFAAALTAVQPDLAVVVAFRILPWQVFSVPRLGTFNLHASLLPKYRGAAPINWAIINGETETGVTTFFLEETVDTGGIILQDRLTIGPDEDAGSVHDRLAVLGATAVVETVRRIERGEVFPRKQDPTAATPAPKIFREDCRIRWDRPAAAVHNFVRGLAPSPAAWTVHGANMLKIYRTAPVPGVPCGVPGSVELHHGGVTVVTADGNLSILELQQEGHRRMPVAEFLRGYRISTGELLV